VRFTKIVPALLLAGALAGFGGGGSAGAAKPASAPAPPKGCHCLWRHHGTDLNRSAGSPHYPVHRFD
jgi:hypothetical protein